MTNEITIAEILIGSMTYCTYRPHLQPNIAGR